MINGLKNREELHDNLVFYNEYPDIFKDFKEELDVILLLTTRNYHDRE